MPYGRDLLRGPGLEMQMWSGTSAFVAAVGDELPGLDSLADGDGPTADVAVDGGILPGCWKLDPLPEAADGAVAMTVPLLTA